MILRTAAVGTVAAVDIVAVGIAAVGTAAAVGTVAVGTVVVVGIAVEVGLVLVFDKAFASSSVLDYCYYNDPNLDH